MRRRECLPRSSQSPPSVAPLGFFIPGHWRTSHLRRAVIACSMTTMAGFCRFITGRRRALSPGKVGRVGGPLLLTNYAPALSEHAEALD
jgi:hypothetical protein